MTRASTPPADGALSSARATCNTCGRQFSAAGEGSYDEVTSAVQAHIAEEHPEVVGVDRA